MNLSASWIGDAAAYYGICDESSFNDEQSITSTRSDIFIFRYSIVFVLILSLTIV